MLEIRYLVLPTERNNTMILGALEAGGTKMVCAVGDENGNLTARISFPTKTPEETSRRNKIRQRKKLAV